MLRSTLVQYLLPILKYRIYSKKAYGGEMYLNSA